MRVKHIPCGNYANQSEKRAVELIKSELTNSPGQQEWVLLSNVMLSTDSRVVPDEIDLIAIGPRGVFPFEIKHWSFEYLPKNHAKVQDESNKFTHKIRKVVTLLTRNKIDPGFLKGGFLLTDCDGTTADRIQELHGSLFTNLRGWRKLIDSLQPEPFDTRLVNRITEIMSPTTKLSMSGRIRTLGNIRNLELRTPTSNDFHRIYTGEHCRSKEKLIVHLYDLSASFAAYPERIASREFEAIQKLQKLNCTPRIMDSFQEVPEYPGEMYFFSICDPLSPTISERQQDSTWLPAERLQFAIETLKHLQSIHDVPDFGIPFVHRRLSPQTVRVMSNNTPLFTEFELSRVSGTSTLAELTESINHDVWSAPEVVNHGLTSADQSSDIYSICKSLLSVFEGNKDDLSVAATLVLELGCANRREVRRGLKQLVQGLLAISTPELVEESEVPDAEFWSAGQMIQFRGGKFEILNRLGLGSFGFIFHVCEIDKTNATRLGSFTAKVMRSRENVDKCLFSHRLIRPLSTEPTIPTIFEVAETTASNRIAILSEFVAGVSLKDWIGYFELLDPLDERSPQQTAEQWLTSLCATLAALHRHDVVHGDISPGNIIIRENSPMLIDFDLAQREGETVWAVGTNQYIPSERRLGSTCLKEHDVYSLAATLFHVFFGKVPFWHDGVLDRAKGLNWDGIAKDCWGWIPSFLDKATSTCSDNRFVDGADAHAWILSQRSQPSTALLELQLEASPDPITVKNISNPDSSTENTDSTPAEQNMELGSHESTSVSDRIADLKNDTILIAFDAKSSPELNHRRTIFDIPQTSDPRLEVIAPHLETNANSTEHQEPFSGTTEALVNKDSPNGDAPQNQSAPSTNVFRSRWRSREEDSEGEQLPDAEDLSPRVWKQLAAWAKNNRHFNAWERQFLYSLGNMRRGLSAQQLNIAKPLLKYARRRGFDN